ncbi:hypothetical protein BGZ63DRAFT_421952 [Mariannaea sp. PMI_226]|nr:hypothetical protein BGZ63DRAFT_421952 [Mariannaea sp. PMI_226]
MLTNEGQKKLKCDGEYPECGRCVSTGDTCKYSARLPLGRPKKRKTQGEEDQITVSSANTTTGTPPTPVEKSSPPIGMRKDADVVMSQSGFEFTSQLVYDPSLDQSLWGCETDISIEPDQTVLRLDSTPSEPSCSCLASIYLCLEETRATHSNMSFSSGLIRLRTVVSRALGILQCQVCPTNFVWAMQNSQLLNTLLVSMAETYRRLVQSIEEEAKRAASNDETKPLLISETQPGLLDLGSADGNFSSPSLRVTLAPHQWEAMAKSAVRQEIFGSADANLASFSRLLQLMEERQLGWHSGALPSCVNLQHQHHNHRQSTDREPMCVTMVRHTKSLIDRLDLHSI